MNILFLDDDAYRHSVIQDDQANFHQFLNIWYVRTAKEAIEALTKREYDFVSLDHDLGGKVFVDSNLPETGYQVAVYIAQMQNPPKIIRVHSYNPEGASRMVAALANAALEKELRVYYHPFSGKLF